MLAWEVRQQPGPISTTPLHAVVRPRPEPAAGELLLRVRACAVCRTDLHVTEGDLPVHRPRVTPGHEIVGEVVETGAGVEGFRAGERVGVAWLRHTCGHCAYCRRGAENLCPESRYTGWDADGGYAEYTVAPAAYVYRLPERYTDTDIPPLNYERHLFQERQLRSVTANTREDGRDFLAFAGAHRLAVTTTEYPLRAADAALADLAAGRVNGAAVLVPR